MGLTINNNLEAMNASRNLNTTENMLSTSMQRLSSGLKINSAADDVAGYAISESLQSQVNGLNQASENIQDAVALAQTAQGALNDVNQMLQRIRELAVQYSNGTTSEEDQKAIISEVTQLADEIKRVGETTQFNGKNLLNAAEEIRFQVGANDNEGIGVTTIELYKSISAQINTTTLGERLAPKLTEAEATEVKTKDGEVKAIRTEQAGFEKTVKTLKTEIGKKTEVLTELEEAITKGTGPYPGGKTKAEAEAEVTAITAEVTTKTTTLGTEEGEVAAKEALAVPLEVEVKAKYEAAAEKTTGLKEISEAIAKVSGLAGEFGAVQDRIQYTQSNLEVYSQNLTSAVSALVDVNMATEMTNFTKDQVLQQAGVAILSQANQLPDATLKLLE
ncbi:MAG TPA: flagellin [Solirubrobacteraceae bacterium]|jgi:flagellin|nr:flagellin [Solirubrobacteraceae bacterium]